MEIIPSKGSVLGCIQQLAVDSALIETTLTPDTFEWLERKTLEQNVDLPPEIASAIRRMLMAVCDDGERLNSVKQERELLSSTLNHVLNLAMATGQGVSPSTIPRRSETRMKVVNRAVEFMRASLHDDIGVSEICAAAFASRRTLHYCFEEFLHSTPQAYLRALRLNEARRTLKVRADLSITELACVLGFATASHFTRHYKRMFDEMPSHTRNLQKLARSPT